MVSGSLRQNIQVTIVTITRSRRFPDRPAPALGEPWDDYGGDDQWNVA